MSHTKEHHSSGFSTYIKDLVYGANDGIITTFAVVTGTIGAGLDSKIVIILGIANLLADGFSMGASNFLGQRSENALYRKEEKREYDEVDSIPQVEKKEVYDALISHGFADAEATTLTEMISHNRDFWVDFMMKYELGMPAPEHGDEWKGAVMTVLAFVIAGSVPLLSFMFEFMSQHMFLYSCIATAIVLFVVGSIRCIITHSSWWKSGLEMLLVGGIAACVSYGVGYIVSTVAGI